MNETGKKAAAPAPLGASEERDADSASMAPQPGATEAPPSRSALGAALRENLHRRKAQARARRASSEQPDDDPSDAR